MSLTRGEVDTIEDEDSAARAWLELEHERQQPATPLGRQVENRAATAKLEQDWPGARQHAAHASSEQLGGLSPRLKRTRDAHRKKVGVTSQDAARARQRRGRPASPATSRGTRPASTPQKPSRRSPSSPGRVARAAGSQALDVAETIAPVGVSYGRLAFQAAGWAVGLSLLYLVLTNAQRAPKGRSAVELIANGAVNAVNALVSPLTDPLSPRGGVPPEGDVSNRDQGGGVPVYNPSRESPAAYDKRLGDYLRTHPPSTTTRPSSGVGVLRPGGTLGGLPTTRSPQP